MNPEDAFALAEDYVRDLGPLHGNGPAIDGVCRRWLEELGARDFGVVNAAAARFIFTDCLTTVPHLPAGSTTFAEPRETA